jgi:hypothetical protein
MWVMKRMKRRVFTVLSMLSLVLCIATCAEWVRSYWMHDVFERRRPLGVGDREAVKSISEMQVMARVWDIEFARGRVCLTAEYVAFWGNLGPVWERSYIPAGGDPYFDGKSLRWFGYGAGKGAQYEALIPLWVPIGLFALAPGIWLRSAVRRFRNRNGFCRECGYDLRATPNRCPECGKVVVNVG